MKVLQRIGGDEKGKNFDTLLVAVTTDEANRLRKHRDWINASLYAGSTEIFPRELGRLGECRVVLEESVSDDEREKIFLHELEQALL